MKTRLRLHTSETMADVLPSNRVIPNTRDGNTSRDALTRSSFSSKGGIARPKSPETKEGMDSSAGFRSLAADMHCIKIVRYGMSFADVTSPARPLSIGKGYPGKLMPTFASNQSAAKHSLGTEGRGETQPIDPLSHVRLLLEDSSWDIGTYTTMMCVGHSQANDHLKYAASEDALTSTLRRRE